MTHTDPAVFDAPLAAARRASARLFGLPHIGYRRSDGSVAATQLPADYQGADVAARELYAQLTADGCTGFVEVHPLRVYYNGRPATASRVELLPNGLWRAQFADGYAEQVS